LTAALLLPLAACGGTGEDAASDPEDTARTLIVNGKKAASATVRAVETSVAACEKASGR
jgi:hypothetical protein